MQSRNSSDSARSPAPGGQLTFPGRQIVSYSCGNDGQPGSYRSSVGLVLLNALMLSDRANFPDCRQCGNNPQTGSRKSLRWFPLMPDTFCLFHCSLPENCRPTRARFTREKTHLKFQNRARGGDPVALRPLSGGLAPSASGDKNIHPSHWP